MYVFILKVSTTDYRIAVNTHIFFFFNVYHYVLSAIRIAMHCFTSATFKKKNKTKPKCTFASTMPSCFRKGKNKRKYYEAE